MKISRYDSNQYILHELGRRIKEYRISIFMTQKDMSIKSQVSLRTLSNIENGKDVSLDNLIRVLKVLGIENNFNELIPEQTENNKKRYKAKISDETEWHWEDEQ